MWTEVSTIQDALDIVSEALKKGKNVNIKPLENGWYRIQYN